MNDAEYMASSKAGAVLEALRGELIRHQPSQPTTFIAEWALRLLPSNEIRRNVFETSVQPMPDSSVVRRQVRSRLVVITGPSGVGKGTLIKQLMEDDPGAFGFSVSHTTRYPRPGEVCGKDYHFLPQAEFEKLIREYAFVEHANVHDNYYGTSKMAIEEVWKSGRCCILDIDVQGASQVHTSGMSAIKIFIRPPSQEELSRRLVGRATESAEKVQRRLENAVKELDVANRNEGNLFDRFVVNDNLTIAVQELKDAIYQ